MGLRDSHVISLDLTHADHGRHDCPIGNTLAGHSEYVVGLWERIEVTVHVGIEIDTTQGDRYLYIAGTRDSSVG